MVDRKFTLCLGGNAVPLPCFFPSVSSVKTNLMSVDYVELLDAAAHPLYLVSAYDIAKSCAEHKQRIDDALKRSKGRGSTILMDSGNYEAFWRGDKSWRVDHFHAVCQVYEHDLCFCFDNQNPPGVAEAIAEDVIAGVISNQSHTAGTVVPIVHGRPELLPDATQKVARQLFPVLLAIPERALGEGIVARIRSVRRIRKALDMLGFYCPLHILGTGNPISIVAYTMAGADSFDGLEWCQTVVDHRTGALLHFQHWDFVKEQTRWGKDDVLPYIQSVLMHNLEFYGQFMKDLQAALKGDTLQEFLIKRLPEECSSIILRTIEEDE